MTCIIAAYGQNTAVGTYEQTSFIAPGHLKDSENDLVITQDPQASKKIWVTNLVAGAKIYAIVHTKTEDNIVYKIPAQMVNGYAITVGCVMYDIEEQKVVVSINNKGNCYGISQSDYDKSVSIGKDGIKAGDIQVGSNGTIKGNGADISKDGVKVDTKKIMAGVQYVGQKAGSDKED